MTNIVKNNAGVYQYELARFKTNANGIIDFQDMRTFLDFNSIYTEIQNHIDDIDDGSLWLLKTGGTISGEVEIDENGDIVGNISANARNSNKIKKYKKY